MSEPQEPLMAGFYGGPADGFTQLVDRLPEYLRVMGHPGAFTALDSLGDRTRTEQPVYAYRQIMGRMGMYLFIEPQPPESVLRTTEGWRAWCLAQKGVAVKEEVT